MRCAYCKCCSYCFCFKAKIYDDDYMLKAIQFKQELFTLQFCRDIPWVIASGGAKGEVNIWDTCES